MLSASADVHAQAPRGHLLVIGGGSRPASIMTLFACLAGDAKGKVLVFPQASERPEAGSEIEAELKKLGLGQAVVVPAKDPASADSADVLRLADGATGVYFGGGDQGRLMAVLRGTKLEQRLKQLYRDGAALAGTSAGAAVMSRVMITGDEKRPLSKDDSWQTIEAENVVTADGLGLLDDVIVDQHFARRRRHNRLISLVLERPNLLGVAIDESTAAWVKPGGRFEVVGEGPILVFDASQAKTGRDTPGFGLRGSDLRLHVLRPGSEYDIAKRAVVNLQPRSAAEKAADAAARCVAR
jgi:cyanophycinase